MPELPEVETIARELKPLVLGSTIEGFWTDWPRAIKHPAADAFAVVCPACALPESLELLHPTETASATAAAAPSKAVRFHIITVVLPFWSLPRTAVPRATSTPPRAFRWSIRLD